MLAVALPLGAGVQVQGAVEPAATVGNSTVVEGIAGIGAHCGGSGGRLGEVLLKDVEDGEEGVTDAGLAAQPLAGVVGDGKVLKEGT